MQSSLCRSLQLMVTEHQALALCSTTQHLPHLPQGEIPLCCTHHQRQRLSGVFHSLSPKTHHLQVWPWPPRSITGIQPHRRHCSCPKPQTPNCRGWHRTLALGCSTLEVHLLTSLPWSLGLWGHLTIFLTWLLY